MQRLQVHHIQFRSHSGADLEDNLITLCSECHAQTHLRPLTGGVQTLHIVAMAPLIPMQAGKS